MAGYFYSINTNMTGGLVPGYFNTGFVNSGWTGSPGNYSITTNGRTSTVVYSTDWSGQTAPSITLNGLPYYIPVFGQDPALGGYYDLQISIAPHWFYFSIRGISSGSAGAQDATYGSNRAFALLTTINPAISTDTDLDGLQFVAGSNGSTSRSSVLYYGRQKKNIVGASNSLAELACIRPAVQSVSGVGVRLPMYDFNGTSKFASPYWVVDQTYGVRGTLDNVAYLGPNYTISGDGTNGLTNVNSAIYRNGENWLAHVPFGYPGAAYYSPLGESVVAGGVNNSSDGASGPRIAIRKGDGTQ